MARGYPTARNADAAYPVLDDVIDEGVCILCKKRPATSPRGERATCDEALHGGSGSRRS